MPLRWSGTLAPLTPLWSPEGIQMVPDPSKVPLWSVIALSAGESDDAAVAISFGDEDA